MLLALTAAGLPSSLQDHNGSVALMKRYPNGRVLWQKPVIGHLEHVCTSGEFACQRMDLYEFGVFTGVYLRGVIRSLNHSGVPFHRAWGFDSFQGLPPEQGTVRSKTSQVYWHPGAFSSTAALGEKSAQQILRYIDDERVSFVPGFYNESLTPTLKAERKMRPALYVEIDCDLYISTVQALDWMLENKLIIPGTLVGYDDFLSGGKDAGEWQAHNEMVAKYGLQMKMMPGTKAAGKLFLVLAVNATNMSKDVKKQREPLADLNGVEASVGGTHKKTPAVWTEQAATPGPAHPVLPLSALALPPPSTLPIHHHACWPPLAGARLSGRRGRSDGRSRDGRGGDCQAALRTWAR